MKLVYCPRCHDVFKLDYKIRFCKCGKCFGAYLDKLNAWHFNGVALGFNNHSLNDSLKHFADGWGDPNFGIPFTAFIIKSNEAQSCHQYNSNITGCRAAAYELYKQSTDETYDEDHRYHCSAQLDKVLGKVTELDGGFVTWTLGDLVDV